MNTSMFVSQYEEDPWGSSYTNTPDMSRSFTTPNFATSPPVHTTADAADSSPLSRKRIEYNATNVLRRISANQIEKIMQIVAPNGASHVTQPEFNTALALLACAQHKLDISLDSLHKNKNCKQKDTLYRLNAIDQRIDLPELSIILQQEPSKPVNNTYPGMKKEIVQQKHDKPLLDTKHWFENIEEITVTVAPEREGFIFKHVNYIVTNEKRSSIVLRRYSDFWWLWEVLLKRYPFRALPNLPPKKLGGRDAAFLEKRRKGLSRFINAVIRHPVLRQDDILSKFLTEPSELAAWRKQNPPNVDEEFKRKPPSIDQINALIPDNLDEQLQKTKKRVSAAIHHYINLCLIMERMIRRMHGQAADYSRYSIALNSLAEAELRYHAGECRNCQQVVRGYEMVAKHMQSESSILESQDLEERRSRLSVNQTDAITKRLSANRAKLHQNSGVPGLEAEVERLKESIEADENELVMQQHRLIYIRYCMWSEMIYIHKQQAFISTLYQDYVKNAIHFSNLRSNNWQELEEPTFEMPTDVHLFE
ncbi:hypothetical protein BCV72DRAFT_206454 [Rhizopus microsporus var. microsporus]|uniref:Sorting nexin MVP1 n=1 Tax=Rhizopus microsporus var. microsporus TaxID=86635 RepID=A0A1X0R4J0_RHIZD|nr:hypothetical protein BCV72DRAFT_206454 [Rhizopus microsporus var. microsporus]